MNLRCGSGTEYPDVSFGHVSSYAPMIPYFSSQVMDQPLSGRPEPKSRYLPSKWEHQKVMKIVRAIRAGRITPRRPGAPKPVEKPQFYALWSASDDTPTAPHPMHMPAPKLIPPGHSESYNPPEEYLWTKEEEQEFNEQEKEDKKGKVVPRKYSTLRHVPAYDNFVQERFERCLDLYLAPRMLRRKPRLDIKDPSELLPRLPSPQELRPFPTTKSVTYLHPNGVRVRSVSIDPTGMWVITGAEDGEVRLWECAVGRCAMKWKVGGPKDPVLSVEWCPDREKSLFAAVTCVSTAVIPTFTESDPISLPAARTRSISSPRSLSSPTPLPVALRPSHSPDSTPRRPTMPATRSAPRHSPMASRGASHAMSASARRAAWSRSRFRVMRSSRLHGTSVATTSPLYRARVRLTVENTSFRPSTPC